MTAPSAARARLWAGLPSSWLLPATSRLFGPHLPRKRTIPAIRRDRNFRRPTRSAWNRSSSTGPPPRTAIRSHRPRVRRGATAHRARRGRVRSARRIQDGRSPPVFGSLIPHPAGDLTGFGQIIPMDDDDHLESRSTSRPSNGVTRKRAIPAPHTRLFQGVEHPDELLGMMAGRRGEVYPRAAPEERAQHLPSGSA